MKCVECNTTVDSLFTDYGRGTSNIRLAQCKNCKQFADKYIELDFVLISIDVILMKPQVYRHLLFNSLSARNFRNVINFSILIVLFDVFLIWSRLEKRAAAFPSMITENSFISLPIVRQYLYLLLLCLVETATYQISIIALMNVLIGWKHWTSACGSVILSSSTKMLPVFMVIWDYDIPAAAMIVEWVVLFSNMEALSILTGKSRFTKIGLIVLLSSILRSFAVYFFLHHTALTKIQQPDNYEHFTFYKHLVFQCFQKIALTAQTAI
ncbi:Arv1-like family protein [Schizosaccharomyces cryophilus OY26]|uniref:Protein ARV n=1 Tax=Schizosaccharomyces cryophilus (strain OY26 / ATCC MYA-4695 / CBS 11777 / NBRC 106824 / NRRL Y48691) TaxID=653667 RepID=S9W2P9_SCHCR|nr:Arv1-like family protein [Schizosaccharomyces cryophilus OY26]EPY52804.1 Arv1-like family protein [Schizosaccharomyces cryophilus OY26]